MNMFSEHIENEDECEACGKIRDVGQKILNLAEHLLNESKMSPEDSVLCLAKVLASVAANVGFQNGRLGALAFSVTLMNDFYLDVLREENPGLFKNYLKSTEIARGALQEFQDAKIMQPDYIGLDKRKLN